MAHEHGHEHEHGEEENGRGKKVRLVLAIVIFGILLLLEHVVKLPILKNRWVNLICYLVPYLLCGTGVIREAAGGILHGEVLDENFLMFLASVGAFFVGENAEAAAVFLFYGIGEMFEDYAVDKSHDSIRALLDIVPQTAHRLEGDGTLVTLDPKDLKAGDIIQILPGERIPVDCEVREGSSRVDTSSMTGESVPQGAGPGDSLISGYVNGPGTLQCLVQKEYRDSTVARVLELTEEAADRKSETENFITKFARVYTPIVVGAAVLLCVIPPLLAGQPFSEWLRRACTFLVISCPCALVVSVPLSFFAGLGTASANGILIKGSNYLEALSGMRTLASDKTGTLTKGEFKVQKVMPAAGVSEEELMKKACTAESLSDHPIALSILAEAKGEYPKADRSEYLSGKGLVVKAGSSELLAGNDALMEQYGVPFEKTKEAGTLVRVAENGKYLGTVLIADSVKPEAKEALEKLRQLGVKKIALLTGDNETAAEAVREELGLDEVHASLLPEGKITELEKLKQKAEGMLGYVGDGINDAPVLKRADVGISMGCLGSDAAIEAADVVIMDDDLLKIPKAMRLAGDTMKIAKQNIVFALFIKVLFLILGAFGITGMWMAVFADVGVTVLCILNSMRMLAWKE